MDPFSAAVIVFVLLIGVWAVGTLIKAVVASVTGGG
jgi:hypothetical protein